MPRAGGKPQERSLFAVSAVAVLMVGAAVAGPAVAAADPAPPPADPAPPVTVPVLGSDLGPNGLAVLGQAGEIFSGAFVGFTIFTGPSRRLKMAVNASSFYSARNTTSRFSRIPIDTTLGSLRFAGRNAPPSGE